MDCNLKKIGQFFQVSSRCFGKMAKNRFILFFLGEIIIYFPSGARRVFHIRKEVLSQYIFELF